MLRQLYAFFLRRLEGLDRIVERHPAVLICSGQVWPECLPAQRPVEERGAPERPDSPRPVTVAQEAAEPI